MTDALHRCARCGVADEDVCFVGDKDHPIHFPPTPFQSPMEVCIAALKRELASANALLERCVPAVQMRIDALEREAQECGYFDNGYGAQEALLAQADMRALLADIQRRGGG